MSVPLRLLGLLLTAVGMVVATTGLVLLVQPLDTGGPAARPGPDDGTKGGATASEPDSGPAASRSPLPVSPSPGATASSQPPPTSPTRVAGRDSGDQGGSASPEAGARSPTVTTVRHSAGPTPSADAPAPARPQSETPAAGPTASPSPSPSVSTSPAPSTPPPSSDVVSDDEDGDRVDGPGDSCRHAWPWSGRRGSRGRGGGWGPPLPCDDRPGDAVGRRSRPGGAR